MSPSESPVGEMAKQKRAAAAAPPVSEAVEAKPGSASATTTAPVIVDLGKKKRKVLRALKKGRGKLMSEVLETVQQVEASMGDDAAGKVLVPIVVIYREKKRRSRGFFGG